MVGEFSIGVREELQLVDPATGRSAGRAAPGAGPAPVDAPDGGSTASPVWPTAEELGGRLLEERRRLGGAAAARGLAVVAAGLHPTGDVVAPASGRRQHWHVAIRQGSDSAPQLGVFGLHVRVAVPNREMAVRVTCGAAPYIPTLLALAGSSPFHLGRDTGFHSFRTVLRDLCPRAGPPLPVGSAAEYDQLEALLAAAGGRRRDASIGWDVGPAASDSAVEFRFFDASPRLELVTFLAACARALAAMFADRPPPQPTGLELQVLEENRWRAARFGPTARFVRPWTRPGRLWPATDALAGLVDRLGPVAERLGDGPVLSRLDEVLASGTAAAAMRAAQRRPGAFREVVRWLVDETSRGT